MTKILSSSLAGYVSVDIEAAGPNPSQYAMLSLGACLVRDPQVAFYAELQPTSNNAQPEALQVSGLSLEHLAEHGLPPVEAMQRFATWVEAVVPAGVSPLFVAFNAPFDWMFVNDYFHRYLGHNPFGYAALDIKAFYMGISHCAWDETAMSTLAQRYLDGRTLSHHAQRDAQDQAILFQKLLEAAQ